MTRTGYKEYNMHRRTLNWMGDRHKDKDIEVNLDGIGGVNILVKADVHRYGGQQIPCLAYFSLVVPSLRAVTLTTAYSIESFSNSWLLNSRYQFPVLRV